MLPAQNNLQSEVNTVTIRKYVKNIMTTALVINSKDWTPKQQQQKLTR